MKVISTDNFGGDYPDERFVIGVSISDAAAWTIANVLNDELSGPAAPRFYRVVKDDYQLKPGFEP